MTVKKGRVTSKKFDDGICLVDVTIERIGVHERNVPILKPLSGVTYVPEEGDLVVISYMQEQEPVVMGLLNRAPHEQRELDGDELSFDLDENTELTLTKNDGTHYDVILTTEGTEISILKNQMGDYDIGIETTGTFSMEAEKGFEILDDEGYGIVGDDEGNFTWYHEDIDFDSENTA